MMLQLYKLHFPAIEMEDYVPKFKDENIYSSIHEKVDGKYSTGCIDEKILKKAV